MHDSGSRHALYFVVDAETFFTAFVALISFLRVSKPFGADITKIGKMAAEVKGKRDPQTTIEITLLRLHSIVPTKGNNNMFRRKSGTNPCDKYF